MEIRADASPVQWAKTRLNLGYLLGHRGRTEGGEAGEKWLSQAVEDCRGAQVALRADVETDVWVEAQQIIAEALLDLAEAVPREDATNHRGAIHSAIVGRRYRRLRQPVLGRRGAQQEASNGGTVDTGLILRQ
ncbi:MAG: hypothetical protein OXP28_11335 [Gammaproteobacteria bacterium]|nr:hypothetical protein [Gammaproteobacteria bacterium]MDE0225718.1 hypothetical protein [Gammaproteobacteria bacterium]MDE0452235.1 hypothetical protein [Gammaproteobacteria bacterium]